MNTMKFTKLLLAFSLFVLGFRLNVSAASGAEIDFNVNQSINEFIKDHAGASQLFSEAKGVLVFPKVYKAGVFFLGGEYGEGALRMGGVTADYYSTAAGSFGFQLGAQKKTIIMFFLDNEALNKFRHSENWEVGVDASVAVITLGTGGSIDSTKLNKPIVAFVLDQKGLMYNLTLEGAKFTKLKK